MRILHIDTGADMRGGQHQVLLLLKTLRQAGHECELMARGRGGLWASSVGSGIPTRAVSARAVWSRSGKFDLVHVHDAHAHTLAAVFSRRRFVVSRRVAFPPATSFASRWKYQRANRYLAVSQFVATQLQSAGIAENKIDVVYDAVADASPADTWSPEFPAVALASADPQKGRDLIQTAAAASGIEVVYADDLPRALQRASLFVYISRSEGLGSAVLLAMQMGVPVIASSVGGLAELFVDGVSGLYVKNQPVDIVRAMRRILASPSLALTLIDNARRRIAAQFTTGHLLSATVSAYERALDR